jgi:hypothetical protein
MKCKRKIKEEKYKKIIKKDGVENVQVQIYNWQDKMIELSDENSATYLCFLQVM